MTGAENNMNKNTNNPAKGSFIDRLNEKSYVLYNIRQGASAMPSYENEKIDGLTISKRLESSLDKKK